MLTALANPQRFMAFSRIAAPVCAILAVLVILPGLWLSFAAPEDYQQGDTVRIMFIHVPAAWVGMGGYVALGGASWKRLGSDGAWVPLLAAQGVDVAPLVPANCGFDADWSAHFAERHAGAPLTTVALALDGGPFRKGQFVVTATGIEGSLVYALSAGIRDRIAQDGQATVLLDLLPDHDPRRVLDEVSRPRGTRSMSSHLQSRLGIKGVKSGLLHECLGKADYADPVKVARALKALPLVLKRPRPIVEAISSAGGVRFDALDGAMLRGLPGVFAAGEMVDWEAPTGGYLLTACFASGRAAGRVALAWLLNPACRRS